MDTWTEDLTLSWSIKDLVSNTDTVNVYSWVVEATDGEFFAMMEIRLIFLLMDLLLIENVLYLDNKILLNQFLSIANDTKLTIDDFFEAIANFNPKIIKGFIITLVF